MRILVTGANGFLGRRVLGNLDLSNHEVFAVSRLQIPGDDHGVNWIQANLLVKEEVDDLLHEIEPEGLLHLAWETTHGLYWTSPENLSWVAASLHLLQTFVKTGGNRLVVAGTSAEYSWQGEDDLEEHNSTLQPDSLYGKCKLALLNITQEFSHLNDLSWAWGRIFCPFGPYENEKRLIPKICHQLVNQDCLQFDSGTLVRDFLHVDDLAKAFIKLLLSTYQGPINLASGVPLTIRQVVETLADSLNAASKLEFNKLPDPSGQPARVVASVKRMQDDLGFLPDKTPLERIYEIGQEYHQQYQNIL